MNAQRGGRRGRVRHHHVGTAVISFALRAPDPYAPCDFSSISDYEEAQAADVRVLLTTATSRPTDAFGDWEVRTLTP